MCTVAMENAHWGSIMGRLSGENGFDIRSLLPHEGLGRYREGCWSSSLAVGKEMFLGSEA